MASIVNRVLPLISTIGLFVVLELGLRFPRGFLWYAGLALLIALATYWQLTGRQLRRAQAWDIATLPLLLVLVGVLFLIFVEGSLGQQLVVLAVTVLYGVYAETATLYRHYRHRYQPHTLENLTSYLAVATVFILAASAASAGVFLPVPTIPLVLFVMMVIYASIAVELRLAVPSGTAGADRLTVWTVTVLAAEVFAAASLLPTSIYVTAILTTLAYYVSAGLLKNWHLGIRERSVVVRYVAIAAAVVLLALLTAKWT